MGDMANADNTLVQKTEGNRPLCTDVRIRLIQIFKKWGDNVD
jgi:hypothetical protein